MSDFFSKLSIEANKYHDGYNNDSSINKLIQVHQNMLLERIANALESQSMLHNVNLPTMVDMEGVTYTLCLYADRATWKLCYAQLNTVKLETLHENLESENDIFNAAEQIGKYLKRRGYESKE